ncbi:ABC transporter permease [Niallia oryzisoli]|uniref:ABC transporter permease n=1 Tax=Niallia oryzisoli TaxID=1737571 RepID=A0ABZ2CJW9_9BACI
MESVVPEIEIEKEVNKQKQSKKPLRFTGYQGILKLFKRSIVLIILGLIWEITPRVGIMNPAFCPPFSDVIRAWWELIISGDLWVEFTASIKRSLAGFGLALLLGIPLGLLIGWYPLVRDLLNPTFEVFRNTAKLALLPVFILFLGIGEASKITLVFLACLIPILLNTIAAVKNVDPLLIKSARSMNLSSFKLFVKVILPAAFPTMFTGIRMAGTGCILVLIAAEMVGAKEGLGFLITYSQFNFKIPEMYAGILTISALGLIVNQGLVALEKRFSRWKQLPNE